MPDLVVAGAGMAGLVAAAEARRLGAEPLVLEKLEQPGGSMRLSSGVIWRHRDFDRFRADCPGGEKRLQARMYERLDGDIRWLESLGAPVTERETGNPLTTGARFDPERMTAALVKAAGGLSRTAGSGVRPGTPLTEPPDDAPLVLATGGFGTSRELLHELVTAEAHHVFIRAAPGATGDGLRLGQAAGAQTSAGLDEVYARLMPAPPAAIGPGDLVRLSQLYARHATVTNESGEQHTTHTWSEIDTAQWAARQPRARAWLRVESDRLGERVRERRVGEMVDAAEAAGAPVRRAREHVTVETVAGITTTLGGLAVDEHSEAAPGVYACGADAGGIATGGYASGLAAALVFGRAAARAALGEAP
ncbi:MAG TPA: FAD-binding protein [Thermoleophilaceae bacterium]|nr:FAD-binding protein [Thermoleophilaceae bacterium]